ncbi:DUF359 domain-containing protein [Candidatus Thorarchaeota archaeon]|nr:MAG: DUF359 domain-containing protein [Candidatus Thorarchaeota archaeon]
MAGTWALNLFDRLHIGHQVMLDRLIDMPQPVACVTDGPLRGHDLELELLIQPLEIRVRRLNDYLVKQDMDKTIEVRVASTLEELLEAEGATNFMMYEGPCCTELTSGILEERKKRLSVEDTYEFLKPVRANDGDKVASARIRRGEIDREGNRLRGTNHPPRGLPADNREALKAPKGDVYAKRDGLPEERVAQRLRDEEPAKVISVGDVTTHTLLQQGYEPDVMIVDGITKRGPFDASFEANKEYLIYNPAAAIYPEAWSAIDTAIHLEGTALVMVDGEEDLMGFPAVLLAPDDSVVLYGQPDVGIVWIPVNDENKQLAQELLETMPVIE